MSIIGFVTIAYMRRVYIIKQCELCGKDFRAYEVNPKKYGSSAFRFCSQYCYHISSRTLTDRQCRRCGETFHPEYRAQKFCSHNCFFTPIDRDFVRDMYEDCFLSIKTVAEMLDVSYPTMWKFMKQNGICIRTELHSSFRGGTPHNYVNGSAQGRRNSKTDSKKMREWRQAIFARDDYKCRSCGKRGVHLNADHIKRFAEYPDLRYDINNGQTLCEPCHKQKTSDEGHLYWINQYAHA